MLLLLLACWALMVASQYEASAESWDYDLYDCAPLIANQICEEHCFVSLLYVDGVIDNLTTINPGEIIDFVDFEYNQCSIRQVIKDLAGFVDLTLYDYEGYPVPPSIMDEIVIGGMKYEIKAPIT